MKGTNTFKSDGPSAYQSHNLLNVKREPTLNIEQNNTSMKCGGTVSKVRLAVCPAKDTTFT